MKKLLVLLFAFLSLTFLAGSLGQVQAGYVSGYFKSNGTYVQPYYRSNNNGLLYDNYSYKSYQPLYNSSYYKYNTYKWTTPSYVTQPNYYYGLNSYNSYHSYSYGGY